jgi:hypothetical protein
MAKTTPSKPTTPQSSKKAVKKGHHQKFMEELAAIADRETSRLVAIALKAILQTVDRAPADSDKAARREAANTAAMPLTKALTQAMRSYSTRQRHNAPLRAYFPIDAVEKIAPHLSQTDVDGGGLRKGDSPFVLPLEDTPIYLEIPQTAAMMKAMLGHSDPPTVIYSGESFRVTSGSEAVVAAAAFGLDGLLVLKDDDNPSTVPQLLTLEESQLLLTQARHLGNPYRYQMLPDEERLASIARKHDADDFANMVEGKLTKAAATLDSIVRKMGTFESLTLLKAARKQAKADQEELAELDGQDPKTFWTKATAPGNWVRRPRQGRSVSLRDGRKGTVVLPDRKQVWISTEEGDLVPLYGPSDLEDYHFDLTES